jgi:hypothetical protein
MRVELLHFDGCPNWTVADGRLSEALRAADHQNATVERRRVETVEEAEATGFLGSPTIRIDGIDPFASGTEQVGLACRVYTTPTGLSGSPTTDQLIAALP